MAIVNLNRKLKTLSRAQAPKKRRVGKTWLLRLAVFAIILLIAVYLPARSAYSSARQLAASGREIVVGVKQNDLDQIRRGVAETKRALASLDGSLNWFLWLKIVPFAGGYYSDARHFVTAGRSELTAVEAVVASLDPYKNELGLGGQPVPGQDRVAQGVKILARVLPELDKVEPNLKRARDEVEDISVGKYPEKVGSIQLRDRMEQVKSFIVGVHIAVSENKDALEVAPAALGEPTPKTYLLLFQNDKEIRPTGGFITAYAFLKLDRGHLATTVSDDIYRLDEKLLAVCRSKICPLTPPAPIVKYLPEMTGKTRTAWSMRDSNISPDLSVSMKQFENMYKLLGEGLPFDGIITIDTQVVEELIGITGPIDVLGTTYSAEIDKRCNCPNVIYELEHYAEVAAKGEQDRKAVLGTLMQQILARSLGSIMDKLPAFVNAGITLANDKHIMFYNHDPKTQAALAKLNWTGQIAQNEGDYLHVNDSNFAGGKSNLYVEEKVIYDIKIDGNGKVSNKVTIEYKNPQPFNTWLNGILRDYVRLYVPKGSQLVASKGSDDPVKAVDDESLNKTYFEAFIQVRPQNSRTLSFEYTLPNTVKGKSYPLIIQKQPGAKDHHYIIKINDAKKVEFDLTSDKILDLSF